MVLSETFLVEQNLKWNPSWTKWYSHRRRFIGFLFANRYGWHHRFTLFIATPAHPINTWTIWNGGAIDERIASLTNGKNELKSVAKTHVFSLPRNAQSFFHKENDVHHWILKMVTFQRNKCIAIQRDWCANTIVLGFMSAAFLKASGMPFVWNFKIPSTNFRHINESLKTPAIF